MEQNPLYALIEQLRQLPGIGLKSAQRLAFFFLSLPQEQVQTFTQVLTNTRKNIRYCQKCFNISFATECGICTDQSRDAHKLCLVAESKDIFAIERTNAFKGRYHVLGGLISPIDGFHPELLRINELRERIKQEGVTELILAINPSIEGDATVLYLTSLLKSFNLEISRLAYGLPMGSELDYADELTLQKALIGRTRVL